MTAPVCDAAMCHGRATNSEVDDNGRVWLMCDLHSSPTSISKP